MGSPPGRRHHRSVQRLQTQHLPACPSHTPFPPFLVNQITRPVLVLLRPPGCADITESEEKKPFPRRNNSAFAGQAFRLPCLIQCVWVLSSHHILSLSSAAQLKVTDWILLEGAGEHPPASPFTPSRLTSHLTLLFLATTVMQEATQKESRPQNHPQSSNLRIVDKRAVVTVNETTNKLVSSETSCQSDQWSLFKSSRCGSQHTTSDAVQHSDAQRSFKATLKRRGV